MDSLVRVGIVGCGRAASALHLPALQRLSAVEVVAAADVEAERLQRVADQYSIPRRYTDHARLLDDATVDVVAVFVPARFHAEVGLAALDAGKHVFIEKPLALTMAAAERLRDRAAQASTLATVGFNLRWHRHVRRARALIEAGQIGTPEVIRSSFTTGLRHVQELPGWRRWRAEGGGVLFEIATHHVDLWRFLLGQEIETVYAQSRSGAFEDDTATITARLRDGTMATGVFSQCTTGTNELEIQGQAGTVRVSCYAFDGLEVTTPEQHAGGIGYRLKRLGRAARALPAAVPVLRRGGDFHMTYEAEWAHFTECIRQGRPPATTLDDGVQALRCILAAVASAEHGVPVALADAPRTVPTA